MHVLSLSQKDPLEKAMITQSGILAWGIQDRGAWWATVHSVTKSWIKLKQLSMRAG